MDLVISYDGFYALALTAHTSSLYQWDLSPSGATQGSSRAVQAGSFNMDSAVITSNFVGTNQKVDKIAVGSGHL